MVKSNIYMMGNKETDMEIRQVNMEEGGLVIYFDNGSNIFLSRSTTDPNIYLGEFNIEPNVTDLDDLIGYLQDCQLIYHFFVTKEVKDLTLAIGNGFNDISLNLKLEDVNQVISGYMKNKVLEFTWEQYLLLNELIHSANVIEIFGESFDKDKFSSLARTIMGVPDRMGKIKRKKS